MGQLEQIVENKFGLKIHYYALVNYNAFRDAVNAVGGIDVVIKSTDPKGLYDPNIDWTNKKPLVNLSNGPHHLNGQQALNLARARGDSYRSYGFAGSDFDRTANQRMMLLALKNKATSAGVVTNPAKIASLSDALGNNLQTDLKANQVKRLFTITEKIDSNNVKSLSLNDANGNQLLKGYTGSGGQSALIPALGLNDYTDIQSFILQQISNNPIIQENAKIVVLNGTDYDGLGSRQKTYLESKRLKVIKVGDAGTNTATSKVIDLSKGKCWQLELFLETPMEITLQPLTRILVYMTQIL
jgi:LCP family protein required for cell wall assembly